MGYLHIPNLYKNTDIMIFKECYALEKIHGTSTFIRWKDGKITFHSGGMKHVTFVSLFNKENLIKQFTKIFGKDDVDIKIHGEGYGGCLSWRTPILLSDRTTKEIGDIVNKRLNIEVVTYNQKEQRLENKKVIGWSRKRDLHNWNTIHFKRKLVGGKSTRLVITDNHIIFVKENGKISEKACKDISIGDTVFLPSFALSCIQEDVIRGGLLGDGSSISSSYRHTHSIKQIEYFKYKNKILNSIKRSEVECISGFGSNCVRFDTRSMPEIKIIVDELYKNKKKVITNSYLDKLSPLAIAIWYMDDGTLAVNNNGSHRNQCQLCTDGFNELENDLIVSWFNRRGIEAQKRKHKKYFRVHFSPNGTDKLHSIISPYIHKSMMYKLNKEYRSTPNAINFNNINNNTTGLIETVVVKKIKGNPYNQPCYNERFDIEVEGNHNFFANKVLVHNSEQGMSATYGKEPKFIVFEVKVDGCWLDVPNAEDVALKLGLEFVSYNKVSTELESLNYQRDLPSVQAKRNGCGDNKKREGVVLKPLIEVKKNNGKRIIVKHKRDEFMETATPREVDPANLKLLEDANEIATEWVTNMRLIHVLDALKNPSDIKETNHVIKAMIEDIYREAKDEIVESQLVKKAIGRLTAKMYKSKISKISEETK